MIFVFFELQENGVSKILLVCLDAIEPESFLGFYDYRAIRGIGANFDELGLVDRDEVPAKFTEHLDSVFMCHDVWRYGLDELKILESVSGLVQNIARKMDQ